MFFFGAEAGEDGSGILAEIAGGSGDFPFLIERAGIEFNFGADAGFIVAERFEIDVHPVVGVGAFGVKKDGRTAELGDDDIGFTGAADVGDGQSARLSEFDGVEMRVFSYVGPALGAEITEQA